MKKINNIAGFRKIKLKSIKHKPNNEICVVTITATDKSSPEFYAKVKQLRDRLATVKEVAESKGYKWFKTTWITDLVETNLGEVEKTLGIK